MKIWLLFVLIAAHAFPTCYHYELAGHTTPGTYKLNSGREVTCEMQGYEGKWFRYVPSLRSIVYPLQTVGKY